MFERVLTDHAEDLGSTPSTHMLLPEDLTPKDLVSSSGPRRYYSHVVHR